MPWCRQAKGHYLSQCWSRFMPPWKAPPCHNELISILYAELCITACRHLMAELIILNTILTTPLSIIRFHKWIIIHISIFYQNTYRIVCIIFSYMLLVPWTMLYVDFCDYVYVFFVWSKHYNMSPCLTIGYIPIMSELLHVLDASSEPGPYSLKQPRRPLLCRASWPLGQNPSIKNGSAPVIWYQTPGSAASRL